MGIKRTLRALRNGLRQLVFADGLPAGRRSHWNAADFAPLEPELEDAARHADLTPLLEAGVDGLARGLATYFRRDALLVGAILSLRLAAVLASPILLHALLSRISARGTTIGPTSGDLTASLWADLGPLAGLALAFTVVSLTASLTMQHYFNRVLISSQKITSLLSRAVYAAALEFRSAARRSNQRKVGDMVNLMSSDAESAANLPMLLGDLVFAALTITCGLGLLFWYVGPATCIGLAVFLVLVPLGRTLGRRFLTAEKQVMEAKDKRIESLQQIVNSIRVIKCFCWQRLASTDVSTIRKMESGWLRKIVHLEGWSALLFVGSAYLAAVATFVAKYWLDGTLSAPTVFTALALFRLIEQPFAQLTVELSGILNAKVSLGRIGAFLREARSARDQEKGFLRDAQDEGTAGPATAALPELRDVSIPRDEGSGWRLHHVTFRLQPGEAVAIVGPVGGGKTSLLLALLGELTPATVVASPEGGRPSPVMRPARIGYVPQEAFVRNGSLRDNVTFHSRTDAHQRTLPTLAASGLLPDLIELAGEPLRALDLEIGENGVNLSGGQRARLNLARAAFADTELILLDDPFAALDPAVEERVARDLLFGLWADKTRVAVTHRLSQLRYFDRIVFINEGRIVACGSYDELAQTSPLFMEFLQAHYETQAAAPSTSQAAADSLDASPSQHDSTITSDQSQPPREGSFTDAEDRGEGRVASTLYRSFGAALAGDDRARVVRALLLGGVAVAGAAAPLVQGLQLARLDFVGGQGMGDGLAVYGVLGFLTVILAIAQTVYWRGRAVAAANTLHDRALNRILRSPLRFFDTNPSGRIVNRFSSDLSALETPLAWASDAAVRNICMTVGSLALLAAHVPLALPIMAPVSLFFWSSQQRYREVARDAKRLESISRSPRYSHFKETIAGLEVVRAFGVASDFRTTFADLLAKHMHLSRANFRANRWLAARVSLLSSAISLSVALLVAMLATSGQMATATAGLLLTYSVGFWESLNWAVRSFSELEARMTSFERLSRYANLPVEADTMAMEESIGEKPGAAVQPGSPLLTFEGVSLRYAPHLPLVVKDASLQVWPGQRVGIVGRTGSGKSSLFQSIYRFIHPEGGRITWRGTDTRTIPLDELRRQFALVTQDPVLLPASIRTNLDPEAAAGEPHLWDALDKVTLGDWVRALPGGLDHTIAEGGKNLSQGQRQLLCLARAIVKRADLLLLDEATASVDVVTDRLIGTIIRTALPNTAVLAIAHRIGTLEGFDTVITMSRGRIVDIRDQCNGEPPSTSERPPDQPLSSPGKGLGHSASAPPPGP